MSAFQLAQLNIAIMKHPLDSPSMSDFVGNLDRFNALAESSPGFVWRLQDEAGNSTSQRPLGDSTIVNMSVWKDVESLNNYTYRSAHIEIMRRRKEWFEHMKEAHLVLWWVRAGHRPDIHEAMGRLERLRAEGPTQEAFTFRHAFPPRNTVPSTTPVAFNDECPA